MSKKTIKRETAQMREAFEFYYSLQESRNFGRVAGQFRRSIRTIELWSSAFNWQERVMERDRKIAEEVERRTIRDIAETKANYRKIIKIAVKNFVDMLTATNEQGNPVLKINTIADLEKLVKLDMLLMGEYTEITKAQNETVIHPLSSEDREALKELVEAIRGDIQAAVSNSDEGGDEGTIH